MQVVSRIGTRTAVVFGLTATSVLTLVFGLAPDFCSPTTSLLGLELLFFVFYFLNGLTGALAETACIMLVSGIFQARHTAAAILSSLPTAPASSATVPSAPTTDPTVRAPRDRRTSWAL